MTQQIMNQPPDVISVKDCDYITDMLSWNLNAAKTANHFAMESQDPEIKQELERVAKMHSNHYNRLLTFLQNYTNQQ
ncbi:spore coat protein [Haloplasma contractile]|uniref:Spore coat protein n=1 Tax=Haloplasma contractile SSD-17B TaxID=1033810 RepID=U2FPN9_9MOLU|nr:spore coat protein [Haloplasma contractile]ERJ13009.1 hypothetical protein HLPCO_000608 [Haloplasma contractile SSD-17B]